MKPILFNTDMVRAILDGRKTETRRVIKPQPKSRLSYCFAGHGSLKWSYPSESAYEIWGEEYKLPNNLTEKEKGMLWTPPCHTGDILYVRETWCEYGDLNDAEQIIDGTEKYYYRADGENPTPYNYFLVHRNGHDEYRDFPVWKPSIHMPKEAARIFLRVTNVRVERLQNMPHDAPVKEGIHYCECLDGFTWKSHTAMQDCYINPMGAMKALWDSTIKKSDLDRYGWDANPWVYVISFERISKDEAMKGETT